MNNLLNEFLSGDEVTMIKEFIKNLNSLVLTGGLLAYLLILDLLPRFTTFFTIAAAVALFLAHMAKKISDGDGK